LPGAHQANTAGLGFNVSHARGRTSGRTARPVFFFGSAFFGSAFFGSAFFGAAFFGSAFFGSAFFGAAFFFGGLYVNFFTGPRSHLKQFQLSLDKIFFSPFFVKFRVIQSWQNEQTQLSQPTMSPPTPHQRHCSS
jgi:hypothetical protein